MSHSFPILAGMIRDQAQSASRAWSEAILHQHVDPIQDFRADSGAEVPVSEPLTRVSEPGRGRN